MTQTTPTPGQPLSEADVSLLPCPFCGTAVFICEAISPEGIRRGDSPSYDIDCDGCGLWRRFGSEADAITAWNRRPHAPVSRPAGEGEREQYLRANLDVVWAAVEDMAKIGIQVARTNKDYATEDRDRARIDFIGEVCRRWAQSSLTPPAEPVSRPAGEGEREAVAILKGIGKIDGDGWKDTTTKGEVVYVWNAEKPSPYAPGQYPRIGNEGWSASTSQYDFTPATADDVPAILSLLSPAAPDAGGGALADVAAERRRQIDVEGWTPEHDDEHANGELATAAACYAASGAVTFPWAPRFRGRHLVWPWSREWWKPRGRRSDLVRAGALIVAEIERLDRSALQPGGER